MLLATLRYIHNKILSVVMCSLDMCAGRLRQPILNSADSRHAAVDPIKDKNVNFVKELVEKHSSLYHLKKTMRSRVDVDRDIKFLLSFSSNVEHFGKCSLSKRQLIQAHDLFASKRVQGLP